MIRSDSFSLLLGLLLFAAVGCRQDFQGSDGEEQKHPDMVKAAEMLTQQDVEGALELYYGVLREQPDFAYAHLQLGMVAQRELRDPVAAVYHFRKYLEQRGESANAAVVERMVESELVRLVHRHPSVRAMDPPDVAALREELEETREKMHRAEDRAARLSLELEQARLGGEEGEGSGNGEALARLGELEELRELRRENERLRAARLDSGGREAGERSAAADESTESYVVQSGDNLSRISQKVYGTPHRWREILNANRDKIPNENRLRLGQTLEIP